MIQSTPLICRDFQLAHPGKRTASHRHIASCPPMVASPEHRAFFIYLSLFACRCVFNYFPCGPFFLQTLFSLWLRSNLVGFASLAELFPYYHADPVLLEQKAKNHLRQFRTARTIWSVRDSIQKKWVMGSTSAWPCQPFLVESF